MAQSDQIVQNATFPTIRADINDNLAALFSQSSGPSAPATTVAFQPWVDTSSTPAVWKVRNASNNGWITVGVLDPAGFRVGGVTPIANGGTGATTAAAALAALLPSQTGQAGKGLTTDGTVASWGVIAAGASVQVFTSSGTYTPTPGKTTFLPFATGGGGGGGGGNGSSNIGGAGGAGGTALRLYTLTELGATATITIGAGGTGGSVGGVGGNGGSTVFTPANGSSLVLTGLGGNAGNGATTTNNGTPGNGGGTTNSQLDIVGLPGGNTNLFVGTSFFGAAIGSGGLGGVGSSGAGRFGASGTNGVVLILEW